MTVVISNNYAVVIGQLEAKLRRQESAIAATKLHIEAVRQLAEQEAKTKK